MRVYLRCIDDSPVNNGKPVLDWVKEGEIYIAYSAAHPLNGGGSDELSFYIMDEKGKRIEPFDGVPTWRSERFAAMFTVWCN